MSTNIIVHGDSRDYFPDRIHTKINCLLTDPPYGMNFASNRAQTPHGKEYTKPIDGDLSPGQASLLFTDVMAAIYPLLADECEVYIFTAWHILEWWIPLVKKALPGFEYKMMIMWDKGYPGQGDLKGNWGCGHEVIMYFKRGRREIPLRRSAIIHVDRVPAQQNIHPTEKPVELLKELLKMSTNPGDFVVDPFSGSGSTSVAAMELGRDSLGFEIDERFIPKSRARLETLTFGSTD